MPMHSAGLRKKTTHSYKACQTDCQFLDVQSDIVSPSRSIRRPTL